MNASSSERLKKTAFPMRYNAKPWRAYARIVLLQMSTSFFALVRRIRSKLTVEGFEFLFTPLTLGVKEGRKNRQLKNEMPIYSAGRGRGV